MSAGHRFTVLGPVRVTRGGAELLVGSPQQRATLAVLLLHEGRPAQLDTLVEAVWDDDPPAAAVGTIRTYVSRLRRILDAGGPAGLTIRPVGPGYQLSPGPDDLVDVVELHDLAARGRAAGRSGQPGEAARLFRAAMDLWRGTPLADVPGRWAEAQRVRLSQQRLTVAEGYLSAVLETGSSGQELIDEAAALVEEHPLSERLCELLMVALYRSGRQAEALAAYRGIRDRLADELGVDPGPSLAGVHQRILEADPELMGGPGPAPPAAPAVAAVAPAQLPAEPPAFAGRVRELARAESLLRSGDDHVVVVAVTGMAGVGKTTFALHLAHRVAGRFPDGQLYVNLRGFDPSAAAQEPGDALHLLLEALGAAPGSIPATTEGRTALYRSTVAGRRLVVLLDNAHDADQVRPLLPGAPGCFVIVTSRDRLAGLVVTDHATPVALDVLSPADALDVLAARVGAGRVAAEWAAAEEIVERSGRLPLAIAIVAARALLNPGFSLAAMLDQLRESRGGLDAFAGVDAAADVRAVFACSYAALSPDAARVFRLLALHPGTTADLPAAASLAGLPPARVRELLADLVRAHLLHEYVPGRYTYHDLVRAFAAERSAADDTDEERQAALHRVLGHYVHTGAAADQRIGPFRLEVDLGAPGPGVVVRPFPDQAAAWAWFTTEHEALLAGTEAALRHGLDLEAWRLAWVTEVYRHRAGHQDELTAAAELALTAARRLGDPLLEARALTAFGRLYRFTGDADAASAHLEEAIAVFRRLGAAADEARTHTVLGNVLSGAGRSAEAIEHLETSLAYPSDPLLRAGGLTNLGHEYIAIGNPRRAIELLEETAELWRSRGERYGEAHSLDSLGTAHDSLGEHAAAAGYFERAIEIFRAAGDRVTEAMSLLRLGDSRNAAGETGRARKDWQDALHILDDLGHPAAAQARTRLDGDGAAPG